MFHYSLHISIFFIISLSIYITAANMFAVLFVITETSDSKSKEKGWQIDCQTFRIRKIYSPQQRYNKDNLRTNYLMFNYLMFNYLMPEGKHISLNWELILNNALNLTYSKLFKFLKRFEFDAHLNVFFLAQLQAQLLFSSIVTCQLSLHPSNNYVYNKKEMNTININVCKS